MAIYTKTGDKGETGLYSSGKPLRIPKDSLRITAIGSVDEVNSFVGLCVAYCKDKSLIEKLHSIQNNLFTIGAILAKSDLAFSRLATKALEKDIDTWEGSLPVLKNFILAGGGELGAHLQVARTLARRAERAIVTLSKEENVVPEVLQYINRLSDYLFMMARYINHEQGQSELPWKPEKMVE